MDRLQIINRVLMRLKQTALEDLNDTSVRSKDIQSQFETTLDGLLARYEWSFATKDICLIPIKCDIKEGAQGNEIFKRDIFERHIYATPDDFIRKAWANRPAEVFDIMYDGIHTTGPNELKMKYIFKLRDEKKLPGYFINALVPMCCFDFSDKLNLAQKASAAFLQEAELFYSEATRIDAYNKSTQKLPKSDFEIAHEAGY